MDILDHYIAEEADHIPLLMKSLQNKGAITHTTLYSNLFNFRVNYADQIIIVEDDCGLFCSDNIDQKMEMRIQDFIKRINKTNKNTER